MVKKPKDARVTIRVQQNLDDMDVYVVIPPEYYYLEGLSDIIRSAVELSLFPTDDPDNSLN